MSRHAARAGEPRCGQITGQGSSCDLNPGHDGTCDPGYGPEFDRGGAGSDHWAYDRMGVFDQNAADTAPVGTRVDLSPGITARRVMDGWVIFEDDRPGKRVPGITASDVTAVRYPSIMEAWQRGAEDARTVHEETARLDEEIDRLHGPGAAAAIDAAYADGSIFAESSRDDAAPDREETVEAVCTHGMVMKAIRGAYPTRTCGAGVKDYAHAEHAPHEWEQTTGRASYAAWRAEQNLCGCDRADEVENPHRHERDEWCDLWEYVRDHGQPAYDLWRRAYLAEARLSLARIALVDCGYFTTDEVGDDVAPRICEMHEAVVTDFAEALRFTREYVHPAVTLPAVEGWSWYDVLVKWYPAMAADLRDADEQPAAEGPAVFDLRDPLTQIDVRKAAIGWTVEVTYRGRDLPVYKWAWTADRAEAKGHVMLEREHRKAAERARTHRRIDLTEAYTTPGDDARRKDTP